MKLEKHLGVTGMVSHLMFVALGAAATVGALQAQDANLIRNAAFDQLENGQPLAYELDGGAVYRRSLSNPRIDVSGPGVALSSTMTGTVSQMAAIDTRQGRSFCFRFRGLPQDGFTVADDGLYMEAAFFGNGGRTAYDRKRKQLYPLVQQARRDLAVNGNGHVGGAAVWRDYVLNFYVPFPQVDQVKLIVGSRDGGTPTVGFSGGNKPGASRPGEPPPKRIDTSGQAFLICDLRLTHLPEPVGLKEDTPATMRITTGPLLPLGGRWFYQPRSGEVRPPSVFDHTDADRLLYRDGPDGQYETPFAGNMSTVLRAGDRDLDGRVTATDRPVADNVTVRFADGSMILRTHGLPNHPTGRFPENGVGPGFNPNRIQEQDETYYIPLEPKITPAHVVTTANNSNHALNMGPIGVAANGVVFFNPFDAGSMDASNIMDRCCGHPNQDGQYHYHKYPVCLNSPWSDEGQAHSPLLGWAFDGFPIYGPYESANVMAKDVTGPGALNAFNLHYDAQRGWHYHVTPGRFPYLIGGYWGQLEQRNVRPPRGRGPGPGDEPPPDEPPWLPW